MSLDGCLLWEKGRFSQSLGVGREFLVLSDSCTECTYYSMMFLAEVASLCPCISADRSSAGTRVCKESRTCIGDTPCGVLCPYRRLQLPDCYNTYLSIARREQSWEEISLILYIHTAKYTLAFDLSQMQSYAIRFIVIQDYWRLTFYGV